MSKSDKEMPGTPGRDAAGEGGAAGRWTVAEERYDMLERILIRYPRWNTILDEIAFMHRHAHRAAEPRCLMLIGQKGAGKTTLTDVYAAPYIAAPYGDTMRRPVMFATVPARATPKGLAAALLQGLGDPRWALGSLDNKTLRLHDYLRRCETRLLILDEIQHFEEGRNASDVEEAARWLKILIKDKSVKLACVMVGLENRTDKLLQANDGQLGRLFGDPYVLHPLEWVNSPDINDNEFRGFLDEVEAQLPFPQLSGLAEEELALRCYVATNGLVNWVMRLVRRAGYLAVDLGRERIELDLLAEAFDKELAGERRGIPNPFDGPPPAAPPPADKEEEHAVLAGTNRRGGRRKQRAA